MTLENKFYKEIKALSYDLTENCNLNCTYCFTHSTHEKKLLNIDIFKKSIEEWCYNSRFEDLEVTWWGGEPYLEFQTMKKLTEYSKEMGKKYNKRLTFGATTNGVVVTDEIINWIKDNGISTLISLDGIKEAQNMCRKFPNGKGSWDVVYNNVKKLKEANVKFSIRASLSVKTLTYFAESIKFYIDDLGIEEFAFSPVCEDDWDDKAFKLLEEQLDEIIDYAVKVKKEKDIKVNLYHINQNVQNILKRGPNTNNGAYNPCGAGNTFFGMAVDGTMWPCHRFNKHGLTFEERINKDVCLGYYDKDLNYVDLKSPVLEEIKSLKSEIHKSCEGCIIQDYGNCNTGCVATNYDIMGKATKCLPSTCVYQKILLDKAKRFIFKLIESDVNVMNYFDINIMNNTSCTCYQSQHSGIPPILNKFLDLSKRIMETQDEEKTDEQKALEKEVLEKTIMMLSDK